MEDLFPDRSAKTDTYARILSIMCLKNYIRFGPKEHVRNFTLSMDVLSTLISKLDKSSKIYHESEYKMNLFERVKYEYTGFKRISKFDPL